MKQPKTSDVQSITISASATKTFEFIAKPQNLPLWTSAFTLADTKSAVMETPMGSVEILLETAANPQTGTVDWTMTFPDGASGKAYSRIVADGERSIYCFILMAPPVPLEMLEGALQAQSVTLAAELANLKQILEQ